LNEDKSILSAAAKDGDFSDVQIVHKFTQLVTPKLDFMITILLNGKYIENDTR